MHKPLGWNERLWQFNNDILVREKWNLVRKSQENFVSNEECRVATVREKYVENKFFSSQGKVGEFCGWPGKFRKDLESQVI